MAGQAAGATGISRGLEVEVDVDVEVRVQVLVHLPEHAATACSCKCECWKAAVYPVATQLAENIRKPTGQN